MTFADLDTAISDCESDFYAYDAYWSTYWNEWGDDDDDYEEEYSDDADYVDYCDTDCL